MSPKTSVEVKAELEREESDVHAQLIQERIAKLQNGVVIINVGGATQAEIQEKKDRIDDALHATRAALLEGIIPGGGLVYLEAARQIDPNISFGHKAMIDALKTPFNFIQKNAGNSPDACLAKIQQFDTKIFLGYNPNTGLVEDFYDSGIVDPALVARVAIENAVSVAGVLLMTEATVTNDDEEVDLSTPPSLPM